jgi:pseudouridine synthase
MKVAYYVVSLFVLGGVAAGFCSARIRCGAQLLTSLWEAKTTNTNKSSVEAIRLNKVFKATHSRRQSDDLIASGRVTINGEPVDSAGRRVIPYHDVVALDGNVVKGWEGLNACEPQNHAREEINFEYIKYWKPCGVICTTDRSIKGNILDALESDGYRPNHRVYPVGRLDKDTSGLILLTSDGRLPNSALRGQFKQPKRYDVVVNQPLTTREAQELRDGVVITTQAQRDGKRAEPLTAKTKPCLVEVAKNDRRRLRLTLEEGRNRQIRKMVASLGLSVVALRRYEFMNIGLDPLKGPGEWTALSFEEMEIVSKVISSAQQEQE